MGIETEGYIKVSSENDSAYNTLKDIVFESISKPTKEATGETIGELCELHRIVEKNQINDIRIKAYQDINSDLRLHDLCMSMIETVSERLIGPDMAVQTKINYRCNAK